ncbi:MAG: hypothetical protein QXV73_04065 [Candidatus Micrarchaeia archaeon]
MERLLGEPIPADEFFKQEQANQQGLLGNPIPITDEIWKSLPERGNTFTRIWKTIYNSFKGGLGGAMRFIGETGFTPSEEGIRTMLYQDKDTANIAKKYFGDLENAYNNLQLFIEKKGIDIANDAAKEIEKVYKTASSDTERTIISALNAVGTNLPFIIAGVVTKKPTVALAPLLSMAGLNAYHESREKGFSKLTSLIYGSIYSAGEFIGERFPLKVLLRGTGKNFFTYATKYLTNEVFGELLTEVVQIAADKGILREDMTLKEVADRLLETGIVSTLAAGIQGAVLIPPTYKAEKAYQQYKQEAEKIRQTIAKQTPLFYSEVKEEIVPEEKEKEPTKEEGKPETVIEEKAKEAVKITPPIIEETETQKEAERIGLILGKTEKVFTPDNRTIDVTYAIVPAESLIASHDVEGNINIAYPQELQPRQRDKVASQLQIQQIAQDIRPELLESSKTVTEGAPIVGEDLIVESGNARTIALQYAYQMGLADQYKNYLIENADRFGINPEAVKQIKNPVLVRIRQTPVDRKEFTYLANTRTTLAMSPAEQAEADAKRLPDNIFALLNIDESGNILSPANKEFVEAFLKSLPHTEVAQYVSPTGYTRQLYNRLQALLFAKAFQNRKLQELQSEALDVDIQNIIKSLNQVAKNFAVLRSVYKNDFGVINSLVDAIDLYRNIKKSGMNFQQWLNQVPLFEKPPESVIQIAQYIANNIRSAKALTSFFKSLAQEVEKEAKLLNQPALVEITPRTKEQIINDALANLRRQEQISFQLALPEDIEIKIRNLAKEYNNQQLIDLLNNAEDKLTAKVLTALSSAYDRFISISKNFKKQAKKYDVFGDVTEAVDIVRRADSMGMLVDTFVKNQDLFGKQFSKEAIEIARFLQANKDNSTKLRAFFKILSGNIEKVLQGYSLEEANLINKMEVLKDEASRTYQQTKIIWEETTDYEIRNNQSINKGIGDHRQIIETETGIKIALATESQIEASGIAKMLDIVRRVVSPDTEIILADRIVVDDEALDKVAKKWALGDLKETVEIAGMQRVYFDGEKWRSMIAVSLSNMNVTTLGHEAWHDVEKLLLTRQELSRLEKFEPNAEKRCDMFANYLQRSIKLPDWINNLYTRIEAFFVSLNHLFRGEGFNYVDVATFFNKALRGEYRDRYLGEISKEAEEFDINTEVMAALNDVIKGKQLTIEQIQKLMDYWADISNKVANFDPLYYRTRIADINREIEELRRLRQRGELDFETAGYLQQLENRIIDREQFEDNILEHENITLQRLYFDWIDVLNELDLPLPFNILMFQRIVKNVVYIDGNEVRVDKLSSSTLQKKPLPPIAGAVRDFYNRLVEGRIEGKWVLNYFDIFSEHMERLFTEYWLAGTPNDINVKGRWLSFPDKSKYATKEDYYNAIGLVQHLSNKVTTSGWCIRYAAQGYLENRDLHMFVDEDGNPRVVVVTIGDRITEIRGRIGKGQDIEEVMFEPILKFVKDKWFKGGEEFVNNIKMRQELLENRDRLLEMSFEERRENIKKIADKYNNRLYKQDALSFIEENNTLYVGNGIINLDNITAEDDFVFRIPYVMPVDTLFGEVNALEIAGIPLYEEVDISKIEKLKSDLFDTIEIKAGRNFKDIAYFPELKSVEPSGLDIEVDSGIDLPSLERITKAYLSSKGTISLENLSSASVISINGKGNAKVKLDKLKEVDFLSIQNTPFTNVENLVKVNQELALSDVGHINLGNLKEIGDKLYYYKSTVPYVELSQLSKVNHIYIDRVPFISMPALSKTVNLIVNKNSTAVLDSLVEVVGLHVSDGSTLIAPNVTELLYKIVTKNADFVYIPKLQAKMLQQEQINSIVEKYNEAIQTGSLPQDFIYIEELLNEFPLEKQAKIKELVEKKLKQIEKYEQIQNMALTEEDLSIEDIDFDINRKFLESLNKKAPPIYERLYDKLGTAISDITGIAKSMLRVPWWNEVIKPLTKTLYKINARANVISNEAKEYLRPYIELKDKTRVNRLLLQGDAQQKTYKRYELEAIGLTEEEIKAYYGVRKALDYIQKIGLKRFMLDAGWTEQEADEFIEAHYINGYLPHFRLGRFGVWVGVPDEKKGKVTIHYEAFDTMLEAKKFAEEITKNGLPNEAIEYARENNIDFSGYNVFIIDTKRGKANRIMGEGVNEGHLIGFSVKDPSVVATIHRYLPMLDAYLEAKGVSNEEIKKFTQIVDKEYLKILAKGRLSKRAGVSGYDIDVEKIVKSYIDTVPLALAKKFYYVDVVKELEKIAKTNGELYIYARDLVDYYYGRKDFENAFNVRVRALMYLYYLGLKPAFMFVNLSQRFMTTIWYAYYLDGEKGLEAFAKATPLEFRIYKDAVADFIRGKRFLDTVTEAKYIEPELKNILIRMIKEGELEAIMHKDIGFRDKALKALSIFGNLSERSNRLNAAITAYLIGKNKGITGEALYEFTSDFIFNTQFLYSQANRPNIGRGLLAPFFIFKSYILNYINFLSHIYPNKKAFYSSLALAIALSGLEGIPLLDSLIEIIIGIVSKKDPQFRLKVNEAKKEIPLFVRKGLLAEIGLDGSITFGAPELFDAAMFPIITEMVRAKSLWGREDIDTSELIKRVSPTMVKRAIGAYTLFTEGLPTDIFGKPHITLMDIQRMPNPLKKKIIEVYFNLPNEIPEHEKWLYALGFTTPTLNMYYEDITAIKKSVDNYKTQVNEYSKAIAKSLVKGDNDTAMAYMRKAFESGYYVSPQSLKYHLTEYMLKQKRVEEYLEEKE